MFRYVYRGAKCTQSSPPAVMIVVVFAVICVTSAQLTGCGPATQTETPGTEATSADGGVVQEFSPEAQATPEGSTGTADTNSTQETPGPLKWGKGSLSPQLDQGRPYQINLPAVSGGTPPYQYKLQNSDSKGISLQDSKLNVTLPYQAKVTPLQLQVVVEDQNQQQATLDVTLVGYLPQFEQIPLPAQNAPKARANPAIALAGEQILVFGGFLENGAGSNEMWVYNRSQKTWFVAQAKGTLPKAYGAHRMAIDRIDPTSQSIKGVVFQGMSADGSAVDASMYRFVLEKQTITWSKLPYAGEAPNPKLVLSTFGYDQHNKRFVLFGGIEFQFGKFPTDVYTMKTQGGKAVWKTHKLPNPPAARFGALYAMDSSRKRFFIASGDTQRGGLDRFPDDLWSLSLEGEKLAWTKYSIQGTYAGRRNGVLLVDAPANRVFLWGGATGTVAPVDLSVVNLDSKTPTWETVPSNGPEVRTSTAGVSDPTSGHGFLGFGRTPNFLRDMWRLRTHAPELD